MDGVKKFHFVGIGGMGMSALAQVLHAKGCEIRGSDKGFGKTHGLLESLSIELFPGHHAEHVHGAHCVVWSSAIDRDNPELVEARRLGIPIVHRAELLAHLTRSPRSIAIAGMHGKTTTTNMIFHVFKKAGVDPVLISGGIDLEIGSNAYAGRDAITIFEADESDGSLGMYHPHSAVITNLEEEHMGYYRDLGHIQAVFGKFLSQVRPAGGVAFCIDDRNVALWMRGLSLPNVFSTPYGMGAGAQLRARLLFQSEQGSVFEVDEHGMTLGAIELHVPGVHNILNALGAIGIARQWGLDFNAIRKGLEGFRGTMRRLELKANIDGIELVDDYAHHPSEIEASLRALAQRRSDTAGRLIVVFQPHRYSRMRTMADGFARTLALADEVIVTPIYSAGEPAMEGIRSEQLVTKIQAHGHRAVRCAGDFSALANDLAMRLKSGDMVVSMGAGDIEKFVPLLKQRLLERFAAGITVPQ